MAINQITINLEDCEPVGGYYVFYRPIGSVDSYRFAGVFFSGPIVFTDENDPINQQYEGYIRSHCGGGIFGDQIPWETEGSISEPPEPQCCDPIVLTADTETTIPDGSLPGGDSESAVCCTPFIISACIETIDESGSGSGSESGSASDSGVPDGLRLQFTDAAFPTEAAKTVGDWNTFFVVNPGDEFTDAYNNPITKEIILVGAIDLMFYFNLYENSTSLVKVEDEVGCVIEIADDCFAGCTVLTTLILPACTRFDNNACRNCHVLTTVNTPLMDIVGIGVFWDCIVLASISFPVVSSIGSNCFLDCPALVTANLPAATSIFNGAFDGCTAIETLNLNACTTMGTTGGDDGNFAGITGQTITLTIPTATATDGDVVTLQANNSVTLILV